MGAGRGPDFSGIKYRLTIVKVLVSAALTFADLVTDIIVCKTFWDQGQTVWFAFSVAFVLLNPTMYVL